MRPTVGLHLYRFGYSEGRRCSSEGGVESVSRRRQARGRGAHHRARTPRGEAHGTAGGGERRLAPRAPGSHGRTDARNWALAGRLAAGSQGEARGDRHPPGPARRTIRESLIFWGSPASPRASSRPTVVCPRLGTPPDLCSTDLRREPPVHLVSGLQYEHSDDRVVPRDDLTRRGP